MIVRLRGLKRVVEDAVPLRDGRYHIWLECGHSVPPEQNNVEGWQHKRYTGVYYCQVCATSPHPRTNPEAWAKMPTAPARWRERVLSTRTHARGFFDIPSELTLTAFLMGYALGQAEGRQPDGRRVRQIAGRA